MNENSKFLTEERPPDHPNGGHSRANENGNGITLPDNKRPEALLGNEKGGNEIKEALNQPGISKRPARPEITFLITDAEQSHAAASAAEESSGNNSPEEVKLDSEVEKFHRVIMKNQPDVANIVTVRDQRDQWL